MTKTRHKKQPASVQCDLPGCIFRNANRYWWRVKLPGDEKNFARPLKPIGAQFATTDPNVAIEVAREMLARATFAFNRIETPSEFDGTIGSLVRRYCEHAHIRYCHADGTPTSEAGNVQYAFAEMIELCPTLPVEEFGPLWLQKIQKRMAEREITRTDKNGEKHVVERGLSRKVINQRVGIIKRMFKWAASQQLIHMSVWQALTSVDGLRAGMLGARESEPVRPCRRRLSGQRRPICRRRSRRWWRSKCSRASALVNSCRCVRAILTHPEMSGFTNQPTTKPLTTATSELLLSARVPRRF